MIPVGIIPGKTIYGVHYNRDLFFVVIRNYDLSGLLVSQYAYICPYCKMVDRTYPWFAKHMNGMHRIKIPTTLKGIMLARLEWIAENQETAMRNLEYLLGISMAWKNLRIDEKEFIIILLKRGRFARALAWAVRSVPVALLSVDEADDVRMDDKNHIVFKIYDMSFEDIKEYYVVAVLDDGLMIINNDGKVVYTEGEIPRKLIDVVVSKARSILREKKGVVQEVQEVTDAQRQGVARIGVSADKPAQAVPMPTTMSVASDGGDEPDWIRDNPWVGIIRNNKK